MVYHVHAHHSTWSQVVNLVSSDVRRLDDIGPFWVFLVTAPCELVAVTTLIAVVLGPAPAFAGVSILLLMIPVQVCCYIVAVLY